MSGKTDRSINAPRENSTFAFRDKKSKLFKNIISFGYNLWNYIYLASYSKKQRDSVNTKHAIKNFQKYMPKVLCSLNGTATANKSVPFGSYANISQQITDNHIILATSIT